MIFVDTGVLYAALVQKDPDHAICQQLVDEAEGDLITTDFVIDELLTLMAVRGNRAMAIRVGDKLWGQQLTDLHWLNQQDVMHGWDIYCRFSDKQWSFTDCTSYAVMQKLGITEALALDEHFRQFGFATVRP